MLKQASDRVGLVDSEDVEAVYKALPHKARSTGKWRKSLHHHAGNHQGNEAAPNANHDALQLHARGIEDGPVDHEAVDNAFDRLDVNHDGVLNRAEFHEGVETAHEEAEARKPSKWGMGSKKKMLQKKMAKEVQAAEQELVAQAQASGWSQKMLIERMAEVKEEIREEMEEEAAEAATNKSQGSGRWGRSVKHHAANSRTDLSRGNNPEEALLGDAAPDTYFEALLLIYATDWGGLSVFLICLCCGRNTRGTKKAPEGCHRIRQPQQEGVRLLHSKGHWAKSDQSHPAGRCQTEQMRQVRAHQGRPPRKNMEMEGSTQRRRVKKTILSSCSKSLPALPKEGPLLSKRCEGKREDRQGSPVVAGVAGLPSATPQRAPKDLPRSSKTAWSLIAWMIIRMESWIGLNSTKGCRMKLGPRCRPTCQRRRLGSESWRDPSGCLVL